MNMIKEVRLSPIEDALALGELPELVLGLYTVQRAAKILGLERQTVYQLLDSDNLEGVRILDAAGDLVKVLVTKPSVEAYAEWRHSKDTLPRPSYS